MFSKKKIIVFLRLSHYYRNDIHTKFYVDNVIQVFIEKDRKAKIYLC